MVSHGNYFINYSSSTLFSSLGSTNVTATSLAHRRGDDPPPGSPSDFISYSTGQLCVRNTLCEQGSLSLGARAIFSWNQLYHRLWIVSIFILHLYTSYLLLWEDWGLFHIFIPPISLLRNQDFKSDILSLVRPHSRRGFSMFEPVVWSHSGLGFSYYLFPCRLIKRTGILQALDFV